MSVDDDGMVVGDSSGVSQQQQQQAIATASTTQEAVAVAVAQVDGKESSVSVDDDDYGVVAGDSFGTANTSGAASFSFQVATEHLILGSSSMTRNEQVAGAQKVSDLQILFFVSFIYDLFQYWFYFASFSLLKPEEKRGRKPQPQQRGRPR